MEREPSDMMFLLFIREYRIIGLPAGLSGWQLTGGGVELHNKYNILY